MNVTFACPSCDAASRVEFTADTQAIGCSHCAEKLIVPEGAVEGEQVHRCLICPSSELFVRKDFSQRLGVAIVTLGLAGSCVTWYWHELYYTFGILFATAAFDFVLYLFTGNQLQCYRCHAEYRSIDGLEKHAPFDLETHERYRQQAARMAQANAAAPDHNAARH